MNSIFPLPRVTEESYIAIPGFRTTSVSLITTLLDTITYLTLEVVKLYGSRWNGKVNFKHLKTT